MMNTKRFIAWLLALAMVFAFVGCGSSEPAQTEPQDVQQTIPATDPPVDDFDNTYVLDEITVTGHLFPSSLVPTNTRTTSTGIFYELYEMLFLVSTDPETNGQLYPVLADGSKGEFGGYDHVPGSGEYTVYLKDYIYDSAGNHITASDVVFSYSATAAASNVAQWAVIEEITADDDYTVTFHCSSDFPHVGDLLEVFANCFIFSEKAFNESPTGFATDACGTGPYVLESYTTGSGLVLKAREDYWETDPAKRAQISQANVKTINWMEINESSQKVINLQTGDLDVVEEIPFAMLGDFQDGGKYGDKFDVYHHGSHESKYLIANCSPNSLCGDVNLRMAIFYAIDTQGIVAALGAGTAEVNYAPGNASFPDYNPEWETWDNYQTSSDPAKVKEYLDASSYDGETLELICSNRYTDIAQVIQQQLINAGIDVHLNILDAATSNQIRTHSDEWDLNIGSTAANDYIVNAWGAFMADGYTAAPLNINFIDDGGKCEELLNACRTEEGHTAENMNAWLKYVQDNAYAMGLNSSISYIVYPSNVTGICLNNRGFIVPGGWSFTPAE